MAEESDQEKPFEPTQKRIDEALKKGEVIKSAEVSNFFSLAATTAFVAFLLPDFSQEFVRYFTAFVGNSHTLQLSHTNSAKLANEIAVWSAEALLPTLGLLLVAAAVGGVVQHRPVWSTKVLAPKFSRVSPKAGLKRMISVESIVNLLKGVIKLSLVSVVIGAVLQANLDMALVFHELTFPASFDHARQMLVTGAAISLAILAAFAATDYTYQRWRWLKKLRMSHKELRDEQKQTDGDPHVRQRIRKVRMERYHASSLGNVQEASVVITNPTHIAIALKYELGQQAPVCVAKGADLIAARIRELAREHQVPVVENPPVARALYASVEVDEEISPEHYKAVAGIIGYVMRLRSRRRWRA